jgi:BRCT domain type II-containing protein
MGKANKNKKNKVPKINEEEYAAYIAHLKKEPKTSEQSVCGQENTALFVAENKQK